MKLIKTTNQRGEASLIQTIMVAALIVCAFLIGMLWTKVQSYEKGSKAGTQNNAAPSDLGGDFAQPQQPTKISVDPVTKDDYVRGNRSARVAMIEYSDLECPFCKRFHPTAQQLVDVYGERVMWVYRHFPLDQLHSKARSEAAAAECATILGGHDAFWKYIDKVYEVTPANDGLSADQLPVIAGQIGLNVDQFKSCQTTEAPKAAVEADYQSGIKAGINGTPGNILLDTKTGNTYEIPGAVPYEQLKQLVDNFLAGLE